VPVVVRLEKAGLCGCGEVVAAGERAGTTRQPGRVVCLTCLAGFSAGPEDEDPEQELPAPVAVLIPADWAPPSGALPGWQREAGVIAALPPASTFPRPVRAAAPPSEPAATPPAASSAAPTALAAAVTPTPVVAAPVEHVVAAPVTEAPTPHTPDALGGSAATATVPPTVVAVSVEAAAMTVPSHRRRTLLPAGLLALRPSRGRQPGSTSHTDGATRALLDAAADSGVLSLHDRRMPGRRSRIAHLGRRTPRSRFERSTSSSPRPGSWWSTAGP
jgi:hypothetical protein